MGAMLAAVSVLLIVAVLGDGLESMVLPRRVTRAFRFSRLYYALAWRLWRSAAWLVRPPRLRETFLSWFGPLSLLGLFACWAAGLVVAFAALQWSLGVELAPAGTPTD